MQLIFGLLSVSALGGALYYMGRAGYSWDSKKNKHN